LLQWLFFVMACWIPGPWDQVADPAAANALRICSVANGDDPKPEETAAPKASKKAKAAIVTGDEVATEAA
jgi:hypothetical protein